MVFEITGILFLADIINEITSSKGSWFNILIPYPNSTALFNVSSQDKASFTFE